MTTATSAEIVVVSVIDRAMAAHAGVVATSLAAHAFPQRPVRHIIFHDGPLDGAGEILARFAHGAVHVEMRPVDNPFRSFSLASNMSPASLLRLKLCDLLPDRDRVIYLDADVIVRTDLAPLFDMELGTSPAAAVPDLPVRRMRDWKTFRFGDFHGTQQSYFRDILGLDPETGPKHYLNSGVMVIDLAKLRQADFVSNATAFLQAHGGSLLWGDQDAINALIGPKMTLLPLRWNVMSTCHTYGFWRRSSADERGLTARSRAEAGIIHMTGQNKPWEAPTAQRRFAPPFAGLWWFYALRSPEAAHFRDAYVQQRRWLPPAAPLPLPSPPYWAELAGISRRLSAMGLPRQ